MPNDPAGATIQVNGINLYYETQGKRLRQPSSH
jgi:hypothetical protein